MEPRINVSQLWPNLRFIADSWALRGDTSFSISARSRSSSSVLKTALKDSSLLGVYGSWLRFCVFFSKGGKWSFRTSNQNSSRQFEFEDDVNRSDKPTLTSNIHCGVTPSHGSGFAVISARSLYSTEERKVSFLDLFSLRGNRLPQSVSRFIALSMNLGFRSLYTISSRLRKLAQKKLCFFSWNGMIYADFFENVSRALKFSWPDGSFRSSTSNKVQMQLRENS